MIKKKYGLSLIELLITMILMSLVILGFFSIDLFSRHHVINSDRRAKVQNEISYAIEYMSKYVQQSIGDFNNPPIVMLANGFKVRVALSLPSDISNYASSGYGWVSFSLNGNEITSGSESLIKKISGSFMVNTVMPEIPTGGFYVNITDQGTAVDIGLVGRYNPTVAASSDNPQISMKTRLVSPSSSAQ